MTKENPHEIIKILHMAAYADSASMTNEKWKAMRQKGIGGSDVSPIMGDSPFSSNVQVYLSKIGVCQTDFSEKWFTLDYGHALEPLAAKVIEKKMKAEIIEETGMFRHPQFTFMKANLDRLAILPNGELVIVECKTTNLYSSKSWSLQPPPYYQWQARHYMFVINGILEQFGFETRIDRVIFSCIYGNTDDDCIIRQVHQNDTAEQLMLNAECDFWYEHVEKRVLPICNGSGVKLLDYVLNNRMEIADMDTASKDFETFDLNSPLAPLYVNSINVLKAKEKELSAQLKELKENRSGFEIALVRLLAGADNARLPDDTEISIKDKTSRSVDYALLKALFPEAYDMCVKESQGTPSLKISSPRVKKKKKTA